VNSDLSTRNKVLESSVEYAHAIVAAVREPLVILQSDLRIRMANQAFYDYFRLGPGDVLGEYLYTAGKGMLDVDAIREPLQDMLAKKRVSLDLEIHHHFPGRWR
jgi:two-component system CheB/CheR fusion protein